MYRLHWLSYSKIIHRNFYVQLLECGLLLGQRLRCRLVSAIGVEPQLVPQRREIIIDHGNVCDAFPHADVAVLLVTAHAHYHSQQATMAAILQAQFSKDSLGLELVDIVDAVLNVIGRIHIGQLQFGCRALQLFEHRP